MTGSLVLSFPEDAPYVIGGGGDFFPVVSDRLLYWGDFGGSVARSRRRLAPVAKDDAVVGPVGVDAANAYFENEVAYFATDIPEPTDLTFGVGFRVTGGLAGSRLPLLIGNFSSGGVNRGASLYASASGVILTATFTQVVDGADADQYRQVTVPVSNFDRHNYIIGTVKQGVGLTLYNMTEGTSVSFPATTTRRPANRMMLIGSGYASNDGSSMLTTAQIYGKALDQLDDRNRLYAAVKMRGEAFSPEIEM